MKQKIWLKPVEGSKSDILKSMSEKSGEPTLLECLFLDTADADLLKNNVVVAVCASPDGLAQMAVFENSADHTAEEYTVALPPQGMNISLFPDEVCDRIKAAIKEKPLVILFASSFEIKTRLISGGEGDQYQLVSMLARFEDDDLEGELRAIELRGNGDEVSSMEEYADRLLAEANLERSASPWFEVMRIKASGFQPTITEKKLKKYVDLKLMQPLALQLFGLLSSYIALASYSFERAAVHRLRVETRKMMSLIEAFGDLFGDNTTRFLDYLQKLLDDTDEARHTDLLDEELGLIFALNPRLDFSALQQKLTDKRTGFQNDIKAAYTRGDYSPGLIEMWIDLHVRMLITTEDEDQSIAQAVEKVKEWSAELNNFKKSGMSDPDKVHEYRALVRKVRYALEGMELMVPKRALKTTGGLKKLQEELGMLNDVNQHMALLHSLAIESGDAELAYHCGICAGIFSSCQQEIHREAVGVWKDYRGDIRSLEDVL